MEIELRRRAASGTEKAEIRGLDIADGLQLSHEAEKSLTWNKSMPILERQQTDLDLVLDTDLEVELLMGAMYMIR